MTWVSLIAFFSAVAWLTPIFMRPRQDPPLDPLWRQRMDAFKRSIAKKR